MTLPAKLGKYEIRGVLGEGAMGVVYDGFDPMIGRRVAIKTVRKEQLERSEAQDTLARFKREAQAAGRLNHPNIVAIYEYGEDEGVAFIAMEFVQGRELKDYQDADERFALPDTVRIMNQLLDALDYSHRNGVVHRDIKPANIILLPDGKVKVADFGIARIESSALTQVGTVLGTPSYMSPEQFSGLVADGRSDLFSAGVVLYQLLTGEKPFTGALTTIMHKVLKEEPPAPSELSVQVPRAFDALIKKALAKRPDERFQSGKQFAEALQAAASGGAADATMINVSSDATLVTPPAEKTTLLPPKTAPASSGQPVPARKQSPVMAMAIVGGLFVAGIGVAGYMFFNRGDTPGAAAVAPSSQETAPAQATATATGGSGLMTISAQGLADPNDPRFAQDKNLLNTELREDAKRQLIEKAAALFIDNGSLSKNYALLRDRLMSRSGEFIQTVIEEQTPQTGKDGLASLTTRATVKVREVQKSINQMSQEERVDFIRNNGDPKIAVAITVRNAEREAGSTSERSPVAENLLKARIQSFGFRMINEDQTNVKSAADFAVHGEAKFKKLSAKLAASGLTIEKFVLTSWTVKCTDKKSGEELYYNTKIPEKTSWNSEDEALRDIGKLIGEEFSKSFFLQHFHFSGQPVRLKLSALPGKDVAEKFLREMTGMRAVLSASLKQSGSDAATYEVDLSGGLANVSDLVLSGILRPLNLKLGKQCLTISGATANEVTAAFDPACKDAAVLGRLDSLAPAALMDSPAMRREAIIKNPDTRRRLNI